jgi:DNA-binding NarL/FixJ family response regulator
MEQVRVALQAMDPVSHAGLVALLQFRGDISVLRPQQRADAEVLVAAAERLTPEVVATLRRAGAETGAPIVLVCQEVAEAELLTAVECRVVAILPRSAVTTERLAHSIRAAAAGGGVLPPNLIGELLKQVDRMQREVLAPNGLNASGLTPREVDVLRLMADGMDTAEIATTLAYSERTVKNIIHDITTRLQLRNRSHAVAYALRQGLI